MTINNHCVQEIVTTHTVVVVKSVTKTTVIIMASHRFLNQTVLAIGNEGWDDYRISKVQSRSQL